MKDRKLTKWHCHCEYCGKRYTETLPNDCPRCGKPAVVGNPVGGWTKFYAETEWKLAKEPSLSAMAKALKATGKPRVTIIRGKAKAPKGVQY